MKQSGFYNLDFTGLFIALFIVGGAFGALVAYGIPWLWALMKPWAHAVTA